MLCQQQAAGACFMSLHMRINVLLSLYSGGLLGASVHAFLSTLVVTAAFPRG